MAGRRMKMTMMTMMKKNETTWCDIGTCWLVSLSTGPSVNSLCLCLKLCRAIRVHCQGKHPLAYEYTTHINNNSPHVWGISVIRMQYTRARMGTHTRTHCVVVPSPPPPNLRLWQGACPFSARSATQLPTHN